MSKVKNDDKVKVHYTGTLEDGTVFDSSREREPLEFTVGGGEMIKGFDSAVVGMEVGESKKFTIEAADAYGERRDEMVFQVERSQLPEGMEPEVGQHLQTEAEGGHPVILEIVAIEDANVTLDGNHPLAGKDLNFDIEVMGIA
ncbi:MAG: peptidylprolyl isomerase [Desulfuromonas sp.]|nr:MAG: peptidylprolyl isomerase [Desulfuromonas sp.]